MANNDEPRIQLGKYENGVLEIREGFKKLDDESMEGYEHVRKVIFPASLEELDEDVFSETKELEELDFSRVTKLKEIPDDLVSCKTKITQFVIPQGVKEVGDGFLSEAKKGTKIFVPASVKQMGYINGNNDNDLEVYLFASGIDVDDFETDVNTLYVLSKDYADYAEKLKDCESEAKLREIPEELLNFYSNIASTAAHAAQPIPAAKAAPAAVMSAPTPPPAPAAPKVDSQPAAPVASTAPQNANQQQTTNTKNMANNLIPQELETLIHEYLTDGVLTDKERQVILKKAEGMGLDRDEIDLYLDAQVQKIDQQADAAARRQKGKTCPYCGGSVPQLTDKCPHCGENITAEANNELQEIFENLENALIGIKAGENITKSKAVVERYVRKAKMYYEHNPKVQKLLSEIEKETIEAENRAKSNARKNAIVQFITNQKSFFIWTIVILVAILGIKKCMNDSDQEETELKQQYEQQYELDKPKIDEQYEKLCQSLDDLETPNRSNYKEMTRKLQKIVWTDISKSEYIKNDLKGGTTIRNEYEYNKKHAFIELKRAYAEELQVVYKQVYRYDSGDHESYYANTPDDIEFPNNIRN